MEKFKLKQPSNELDPYLDMLGDINSEIAYFRKRNELLPNYIIVNTEDYERLVTNAQTAKLISPNTKELSKIQDALLIPSSFMPVGSFDVVGN
ncbi:MAG: hypothetical protein PQJ28_03125 [Spirochaetales bacterium]|nr:hypothetical protein [Spirochaetales bacterium]